MPELNELLRKRGDFTLIMNEARDARKEVDHQILSHMRETMEFVREGTHEMNLPDGSVIRAKTSLNRTVSPIDVELLRSELQIEELDPDEQLGGVFKTRHDIDLKQLREIQEDNPSLYRRICRIITSKPRAIALTIKDID